MEQLKIRGGKPLHGEVTISGAKNAVLPILAATLLVAGETIIDNVPRLRDVHTFIKVLNAMGAKAAFTGDNQASVTVMASLRSAPRRSTATTTSARAARE